MRIIVGCLGMMILLITHADTRAEIQERIKPIGQVRIAPEKEPTMSKNAPVSKKSAKLAIGRVIYTKHCITCHQDGLAGAPKYHNAADWRLKTAHRSITELVASALKGINAMPPKGTCFECNEDDIKQAIMFMLPPS